VLLSPASSPGAFDRPLHVYGEFGGDSLPPSVTGLPLAQIMEAPEGHGHRRERSAWSRSRGRRPVLAPGRVRSRTRATRAETPMSWRRHRATPVLKGAGARRHRGS